MEFNTQVLRINIEGRWEADKFSRSFSAIDRLFALRFALDLEQQELAELRDFYFDRPFPPFSRSLRYLRYWEK